MNRRRLLLLKRLGIRYVEEKAVVSERTPTQEGGEMKKEKRKEYSPGRAKGWISYEKLEPFFQGENSAKGEALVAFYREIRECQKCPLGKARTNFVFGMGNPDAELLFVGEAPGADEDAQGLPFVGRAGQLLTKIIEATKIWKREDVFIANILKCRPPGNRTPVPAEVEACLPYLVKQIEILKPRWIVALGATAAHALLGGTTALGKLRGKWHDYRGIPLLVTYHPAALLRFAAYKRDVWSDMKMLMARWSEEKGKH